MPFVDLGDCSLEYRMILGSADRPPLVFLHEGLGSVGLWRDFPDKLARRTGARALIYSRAGYGQSSPLTGKREPDFMHGEALDVLPRLLAKLGIERPLLIGHSDGASIALIHAAANPETVAGVVLMAPHVFVEAVTLKSIAAIAEKYETSGLRQILAKHHAHVDDAFRGWSEIWLNPRFGTWSLGSEVQRLAVPTLLIQGEDDPYGTLAQLDAFEAAKSADITRLVLPLCGHSPHRDQEAAVLDAITVFTAKLAI
jgi:pimeloyl-ACP methyl ester carboxylesterase